MKTLFGLCTVLVCIAQSCNADAVCTVPETKKPYVTTLTLNMADSVGPCITPDPNVLLALNLGPFKNTAAQVMLLEKLKEDAAEKISKNQPFSSGLVALYVLALRSSCSDPTCIPGSKGNIDLVGILQDKTKKELQHCKPVGQTHSSYNTAQCPLTTWYQVALDVLALCVMSRHSAFSAADVLAKQVMPNNTHSVDTASVTVMALVCLLGTENISSATFKSFNSSLSVLLDFILKSQNDGLIGNAYSTGLAGQFKNCILKTAF